MNFRSFIPSFFNKYATLTGFKLIPNVLNTYNNQGINTAIEICSVVIANTVASIPISIYRDNDGFKEVVKDDYRYKMLHLNPNEYTTGYTFWHTMENTKQHKGESFARIHKFDKPKSIELEFIPNDLLIKPPYFEKGILYYDFRTTSGIVKLDSSQIIHFKRTSVDGISGVNPYTVLFEEVKRTYLADKTITNYYENDGKSTKFIKSTVTTGDLAKLDDAANRFRKETGGTYYNEKKEIAKGDFDSIVAFPRLPGNSEIQEIANDQNDNLYLATVEKADLKIAAYYQIPPHYLNIMQAQKNSNVQSLQLDFKSSTIQHTLRSNRQELELKLLTSDERSNNMSIEYNSMAILELSIDERMKQYESLQKTAFITPNEVRKIEGMSPITGGNSHYIFEQMTTLESLLGSSNKDSSIN